MCSPGRDVARDGAQKEEDAELSSLSPSQCPEKRWCSGGLKWSSSRFLQAFAIEVGQCVGYTPMALQKVTSNKPNILTT